ncbi:uncharacterized protein M421DRAFT_229145 [Didymella exigua CBS 183.55]|uniref:Uncharacterized protein n=1 Tax=Didymella exigua CBS 183.55 TaxID=1150837 RepID=A0A6A5RCL0_9PLEO|nr:uncharacterized protein M421DRAFT_229145 [Didymella exigua CBS 183.55]KAF1925985.1 hypothetical protein M421DRAFT_229145 [Didymella exigua CBS 183.55]
MEPVKTPLVEQHNAPRASADRFPALGYNLQPNKQSYLLEASISRTSRCCPLTSQRTDMDHRPSSHVGEHNPPKVDDDELPPAMQLQEQHFDRDFSSGNTPLRQLRPLRAPASSPRESSHDPREHPQDATEISLLDQQRAAHQATLRKPPKAPAQPPGKASRKPSRRPAASKPIKKNDMVAKLEVICEIERCWGAGFIRAYVPKCHRPLVKRGRDGKRAMYREHEADPKKWLPSVLKAILSLAKMTANKAWLKKAMNDVVRYRIKNTGNRKPQLVTTDFDVLEDMLVKDWDIAYSFGIRYKHLLTNPQGHQDTDEDIDHILGVPSGVPSGEEGSGDDDESKPGDANNRYDDDRDEDHSDDDLGHGGLTGHYLQASGYTNAPHHQHPHHTPFPSAKQQNAHPEKARKYGSRLPTRPQPPSGVDKSQQGYSNPYPYGPPLDPWSRPTPYPGFPESYHDHSGYAIYGYGGYIPPHNSGSCHTSQQPAGYNTTHRHTTRADSARTPDSPFSRRFHAQTEVKHETPPFSPRAPSEDDAAPTTELEDDTVAALDAELRATELELKVARLQARRAALAGQAKAQAKAKAK